MSNGNRLAKHVTIDLTEKHLWIDEMRFPFYIQESPTVVDLDGMASAVIIGIIAENVHTVQSLDEDLAWIRRLGKIELGRARQDFCAKNPDAPELFTREDMRIALMADIDDFIAGMEKT